MLNKVKNKLWLLSISWALIILTSNLALANSIAEEYTAERHKFYSAKVTETKIITNLNQLQARLTKESEAENYYWQAQIEFLLGTVKQRLEQNTAVKHFEKSQKLVQKAIARNETSEGYRLLGDTYGRLIEYNGVFYAMRNGSKILDLLKKSIELDPQNYTAYNSLGIAYFKAPKVVGDNLDKAIKNFKQALKSEKQVDNFISYYYLAKCYVEKGNNKQASGYLKQAINIYPNNELAKLLLEKIAEE